MVYFLKKSQAVVAQAFNQSIQEADAGGSLWFQGQLGLRLSSRIAKDTQQSPVSKNK